MPKCPKCGSKQIVTAFDANFNAFCCDCDWTDGSVTPEMKRFIMNLFQEAFENEKDS